MSMRAQKIIPGVIFLFVAGCRVGTPYQPPNLAAPAAWNGAGASELRAESGNLARWWERFGDPALDALMAKGLQNNLDLRQAVSRILEARATLQIAGAGDDLQIDGNASAIRQRKSANTATGAIGPRVSSQWQFGFDAIWELDFFGRIAKEIESAEAGFDMAVEDARDLRVTLAGDIARSYFEFRGAQQRLQIDRDNWKAQQETVALVQAKVQAGVSNDFDLSRAQAQAASTAARIPQEQASAERSLHRLAVLLGISPQDFDAQFSAALHGSSPTASLPVEIPIGLPADLLRRRPDIRRAERAIAQTAAEIGVATADLYPRISLTGALGLQASSFRRLNDTGSGFWSMGPSMSWPVLDAGKLKARIRVEEQRHSQALARYEAQVLAALEEAENALVSFSREKERRAQLAQAVEASARAATLARELHSKGLADFLSVIDAERAQLENEGALASSDQALATSLASLFKALGGGWNAESS